jgi:hypothetical protein
MIGAMGLERKGPVTQERIVMKISLKILLAAGMLCGAGMASTTPVNAQPSGFSFRFGDIGMAYDDGYYDRSRRWHSWRHERERDWYRANYGHQYRAYRHDRDRDGIPNRFDRDRDNDGVPNYRDRRPDNPRR